MGSDYEYVELRCGSCSRDGTLFTHGIADFASPHDYEVVICHSCLALQSAMPATNCVITMSDRKRDTFGYLARVPCVGEQMTIKRRTYTVASVTWEQVEDRAYHFRPALYLER
jgi:hypothetical protein